MLVVHVLEVLKKKKKKITPGGCLLTGGMGHQSGEEGLLPWRR